MKKEEELKDLEKEYKTLTKRCATAKSKLIKLESAADTIIDRIYNLTKNIWEEKAKSLIGKYIAWKEGDTISSFMWCSPTDVILLGR